MTIGLALIIVLVVGVGFLTFFIVRSTVFPQRIEALEGLIKKGKTQTVIKSAKSIITKDPHSSEAHYYLGLAYQAEKREELAIEAFKTVNKLGVTGKKIPELEFRRNLAQIFYRQNQTEEALKEYLMLIKLSPKTGDYYYWAGKLFRERSRSDMAENYLSKAAELCPNDGKIHYELGIMLYRDKKNHDARAALERALKLPNSDAAQIAFYLGKIQKDQKDYTQAIATFEKAARDASLRVKALVERGGCYMAMNAPEKAIPDLERAVKAITDEAAQDSLYARYFLGMCYENTRNIDKAIVQWEAVSSQKKNFRDVAERLSRYQDIRADDTMKDYLTASPEELMEMAKNIVTLVLDLNIKEIKQINDGCEIKAIENESAKWRNTRKMPRLIRFYRSPDPVDEESVRSILDDAKAANMPKTAIFSSSGFSRNAINYANSRSVELCNTEKLKEMLDKAGKAASGKKPAQTSNARG
jgi:tetratricopeptide (TPR) repeat protein